MDLKELKIEFEDHLHGFSTSIVMIEESDPGSFKEALDILDILSGHSYAKEVPELAVMLGEVQSILEECLLDGSLFEKNIEKIGNDLKAFKEYLSDDIDDKVKDYMDKVEEAGVEEEGPVDLQDETVCDSAAIDSSSDEILLGDASALESSAVELSTDESSPEELTAAEALVEASAPEEPAAAEASIEESAPEEGPVKDTPIIISEEDKELVEDFLLEAGENLGSIEVHLVSLEDDPGNLDVINTIFRPFHTIKGVSGFLNLHDVNHLTHNVEDLLDKARNGDVRMGEWEIEIVLGGIDLLRRLLDQVQSVLDGQQITGLTAEVNNFLKRLKKGKAGGEAIETVVSAPGQEDQTSEVLEIDGVDSPAEEEALIPDESMSAQEKVGTKRETQAQSTIKVDMYKLDNLVNMVGELVIGQTLVQQNPKIKQIKDHQLNRDFSLLGRIISELRDTTMTLRMVPIRQTFQKMIRLVRDLARKSDKSVKLTMSGEDTEIDRSMVEDIYEPMVHLVRNSVDHGIESKDERKNTDKPSTGHVQLRAYHKGGNVVIEIQDDGKGLSRERILVKARDRGWITENDVPEDNELYQYIFRPGFSTAEQITDVSGRGVGMDVVKRTIDQLRGKIEIQSSPGQGSTFIISLPITLAIIDGIIVSVGEERYILPTISVQEAFSPKKEDYLTVAGKGELIRFRDKLFPLIRLHEIFSVSEAKTQPWEALVIVVESEGEACGILVDEVLEKQEVVIKSLGTACPPAEGVTGGSILGDGRVGLILDMNGLYNLRKNTSTEDEQTNQALMA